MTTSRTPYRTLYLIPQPARLPPSLTSEAARAHQGVFLHTLMPTTRPSGNVLLVLSALTRELQETITGRD